MEEEPKYRNAIVSSLQAAISTTPAKQVRCLFAPLSVSLATHGERKHDAPRQQFEDAADERIRRAGRTDAKGSHGFQWEVLRNLFWRNGDARVVAETQ